MPTFSTNQDYERFESAVEKAWLATKASLENKALLQDKSQKMSEETYKSLINTLRQIRELDENFDATVARARQFIREDKRMFPLTFVHTENQVHINLYSAEKGGKPSFVGDALGAMVSTFLQALQYAIGKDRIDSLANVLTKADCMEGKTDELQNWLEAQFKLDNKVVAKPAAQGSKAAILEQAKARAAQNIKARQEANINAFLDQGLELPGADKYDNREDLVTFMKASKDLAAQIQKLVGISDDRVLAELRNRGYASKFDKDIEAFMEAATQSIKLNKRDPNYDNHLQKVNKVLTNKDQQSIIKIIHDSLDRYERLLVNIRDYLADPQGRLDIDEFRQFINDSKERINAISKEGNALSYLYSNFERYFDSQTLSLLTQVKEKQVHQDRSPSPVSPSSPYPEGPRPSPSSDSPGSSRTSSPVGPVSRSVSPEGPSRSASPALRPPNTPSKDLESPQSTPERLPSVKKAGKPRPRPLVIAKIKAGKVQILEQAPVVAPIAIKEPLAAVLAGIKETAVKLQGGDVVSRTILTQINDFLKDKKDFGKNHVVDMQVIEVLGNKVSEVKVKDVAVQKLLNIITENVPERPRPGVKKK
jgi:hypothetical protein